MEITQLEQMIRWLDEERKRDRTQLAALQERVEQQMQTIQAQASEIKELRQALTTLQTDIRRTDDYPTMLEAAQRELTSALEELKAQARRERLEAEQMRHTELEGINETLADLDKRTRALLRYEEQLQARAAGEQRLQAQLQTLNSALADLSKQVEDRLQAVVYLEEQRRADTRRLADLEGEAATLRQRLNELIPRQARLEDALRKLPAQINEAIEIAKSYEPRIEELRVADFQREQRVKRYLDQAEVVQAEVERLVEQTQRYALLYNENRQALDSLTVLEERLEQRQNEIAEMQRLAEERLLHQWEEWQASFARDWQKRMVTEEDRWRRQDLANQRIEGHLADVDEQLALYYHEVVALWEELSAAAERWLEAVRSVTQPREGSAGEHLRDLRRYAEEKHKELL